MVRVNLLPIRAILRKRELKQSIIIAVAILVAGLAMVGAFYFYTQSEIGRLQAERNQHQAQLNRLKKENEKINRLKAEIARLRKQVDTIEKLTKTRDTPAPFMDAVAKAIPAECWLAEMSKSGKNFTLGGIGADNNVVVEFVNRLKNLPADFAENPPPPDYAKAKKPEKTLFGTVKLVQVVSAGKGMTFQIVGTIN